MRSWLTVTLGTWHPYKQASQVVWRHWADRVFGPLFHDLIPDANFNVKARLSTVTTFLTYVRLAFPHFRTELNEARARLKADGNKRKELSQLNDLSRLCRFFIPVVFIFIIL